MGTNLCPVSSQGTKCWQAFPWSSSIPEPFNQVAEPRRLLTPQGPPGYWGNREIFHPKRKGMRWFTEVEKTKGASQGLEEIDHLPLSVQVAAPLKGRSSCPLQSSPASINHPLPSSSIPVHQTPSPRHSRIIKVGRD